MEECVRLADDSYSMVCCALSIPNKSRAIAVVVSYLNTSALSFTPSSSRRRQMKLKSIKEILTGAIMITNCLFVDFCAVNCKLDLTDAYPLLPHYAHIPAVKHVHLSSVKKS